jgi:hypothetical protein
MLLISVGVNSAKAGAAARQLKKIVPTNFGIICFKENIFNYPLASLPKAKVARQQLYKSNYNSLTVLTATRKKVNFCN